YQNSGVSVEAVDLHISKEVATIRKAFYYGVLQEIWVLDYRFRQITLFKYDWVNHRAGGVKRDTTLSSDDSNGPSIPMVPVYRPSVQGLMDKYGYDNIEDYLSDFYFPSTDKEDTIVHTGQDPIHECHSQKSKAKYVPVSHKHNPNVKSPNAIIGCVLGLPNINTWDDILYKFRMRTPGRCADKWMNGKNYRKDNHHVFYICNVHFSDDSKGVSSKGSSITSIPKEGPSTAKLSKEPIPKEFLAWYGYDIVDDYLT
ncbi:hypothetical protein Tco_0983652, partial [Tanacetum coccineum]